MKLVLGLRPGLDARRDRAGGEGGDGALGFGDPWERWRRLNRRGGSGEREMRRMVVVCLTGLPCVGKGMVKDYLLEWCAARGLSSRHFSFSDEIKAEARARGIAPERLDRDAIHELVSEMRRAEGPAVLAERLARRIAAIPEAERPALCVAEAARHPAEIESLRAAFGDSLKAAAVTADVERIVDWMSARRRADESRSALQSREAALALLERELRGNGVSVNVGACLALADYNIVNNGTLAGLRAKTFDFAEEVCGGGPQRREAPQRGEQESR